MTTGAPPFPQFDHEAYRSIHDKVVEKRRVGARLIIIAARDNQDGTIELIYLFDEGGRVLDLRFTILLEWEVDSVADVYAGAMNMERENVDLFGIKFKGVEPGLLLVAGKSAVAPLRKPLAVEPKKEATKGE